MRVLIGTRSARMGVPRDALMIVHMGDFTGFDRHISVCLPAKVISHESCQPEVYRLKGAYVTYFIVQHEPPCLQCAQAEILIAACRRI